MVLVLVFDASEATSVILVALETGLIFFEIVKLCFGSAVATGHWCALARDRGLELSTQARQRSLAAWWHPTRVGLAD